MENYFKRIKDTPRSVNVYERAVNAFEKNKTKAFFKKKIFRIISLLNYLPIGVDIRSTLYEDQSSSGLFSYNYVLGDAFGNQSSIGLLGSINRVNGSMNGAQFSSGLISKNKVKGDMHNKEQVSFGLITAENKVGKNMKGGQISAAIVAAGNTVNGDMFESQGTVAGLHAANQVLKNASGEQVSGALFSAENEVYGDMDGNQKISGTLGLNKVVGKIN